MSLRVRKTKESFLYQRKAKLRTEACPRCWRGDPAPGRGGQACSSGGLHGVVSVNFNQLSSCQIPATGSKRILWSKKKGELEEI